MNKIKVEEILKKHIPEGIQNIKGKGDGKPQYRAEIQAIKNVVKEIVELALDKAADSKTLSQNWFLDDEGKWFSEQSILNVKTMIDYE